MQITLIRHGKYLPSNGHLTRDGIEETIGTALLLGNAAVGDKLEKPQPDWQLDKAGFLCPSDLLSPEYQTHVLPPDLILSSSALRAKETAFTFAEQLKQAKVKPEIRYNVAYLNEPASDEHENNKIEETIGLIQRLAKDGKQHVVLISHQPNIYALLNLLKKDTSTPKIPGVKIPENSVAYTFTNVNPENIGKEKYILQQRAFEHFYNLRNAFFSTLPLFGISVLSVDDILWKMPDFMFNERMEALKRARESGHGKV